MESLKALLKNIDFSLDPELLKQKTKNDVLDFISKGNALDFKDSTNNVLNVKWISLLLCDPKSSSRLSRKGLIVNHATFKEELNMEGLTLDRCIDFDNCTFEKEVNFNSAKIGSLTFQNTHMKGGFKLISAQIRGQLNCRGATIGNLGESSDAVLAQNAIINGSVLFDSKEDNTPFKSYGRIDLYGIYIAGSIRCEYSSFEGSDDFSLTASQAIIDGDVIIYSQKDTLPMKGVSLQEATIKGSLYFDNLKIEDSSSFAINAKRVRVSGDVIFGKSFESKGEVKLCGAQIGGQLKCRGAKFNRPSEVSESDSDGPRCAFIAKGLRLGGPLFMNQGFKAKGEVNLMNARIAGNFDCTHGTFNNQYGIALSIERARIDGDVFFSGYLKNNTVIESKKDDRFMAAGEVNLCGAKISGMLNCKNGRFHNNQNNSGEKDKKIYALRAIGISIQGPLFMSEGFKVKGSVSLLNAKIDAIVDFCGGEFSANQGIAIYAERITVKGDLIFQNYSIIKQGDCKKKFFAEGSIYLNKADIDKGLIYHEVCKKRIPEIILSGSRINTIDVNQTVWKTIENKNLHGCIYNSISPAVPDEYTEKRNKKNTWISSNNSVNCSPQPYRQLAKVLDEMGYEKGAKEVRMEMNDQLTQKCPSSKTEQDKFEQIGINDTSQKQKFLHWIFICWLKFLKYVIGYGYKPFRAINYALIIVAIGALFYHIGFNRDMMHVDYRGNVVKEVAIESDAYQPKFSAVVYSLDVFLPIINLHQVEYWKPQPKPGHPNVATQDKPERLSTYVTSFGFWLKIWMYFQIFSGWFLVTLLIGGLSGLIREK